MNVMAVIVPVPTFLMVATAWSPYMPRLSCNPLTYEKVPRVDTIVPLMLRSLRLPWFAPLTAMPPWLNEPIAEVASCA